MPWKDVTVMSLRLEFVTLAQSGTGTLRDLCRRFQISPKTGYKWLARFRADGADGLLDHSRRPRHSPTRCDDEVEQAVLQVRADHPAWGPRKIHAVLPAHLPAPSVSTVAAILRRHGRIDPADSTTHTPWQRFVADAPNALWQMDFKGHVPLATGARCHPLTVLDDHSRFLLALQACANEQGETVQAHLVTLFRRYGLPERILVDNGSPWGSDHAHPYTALTVWFLRLGIACSHAGAYHPQTLGKDERLHRTLRVELLTRTVLHDLGDAQQHFDRWRLSYNSERPHEALEMAVPASRYRLSPRAFPEHLPPIEYGADHIVRKVQANGEISFHNQVFLVGKAFRGYPIGLRPTLADGVYDVYFCHYPITTITLPGATIGEHADAP